jgi:Fe2+ transport system protein FeoA
MSTELTDLLPLERLRVGQPARVGQVVGQAENVRRLRELGFRDGESVEIVQAGRPCIVQLGSKRMCFRAAEMLGVLVQLGT